MQAGHASIIRIPDFVVDGDVPGVDVVEDGDEIEGVVVDVTLVVVPFLTVEDASDVKGTALEGGVELVVELLALGVAVLLLIVVGTEVVTLEVEVEPASF